ncbi:NAD(P)H-hydrate epimerase [Halorussus amylolyticus]|uniref:NAD(P)H-hydrate epimerase n=1 Tax=Halorussus amylolyticus TaxID=1126242 RepID=UPI001EE40703|nr:NAD(P)H-hydrate epimerase [Halorussus amylolyticus]
MTAPEFRTPDGTPVPAVSADEMREIDRIAVEDLGLGLLQMMENAGRDLAGRVLERDPDSVTVLAGNGGNGGGGLACGRHLENRGVSVTVVLDRPADALDGAAATQYRILDEAGVRVADADASLADDETDVVVDALVGYGLTGAPRGRARDLIERCGNVDTTLVSLDVPSGLDATTGDRPGPVVEPDETVTLALPKSGLSEVECELTLADIAIPRTVYDRAGIEYDIPFERSYCVPLTPASNS